MADQERGWGGGHTRYRSTAGDYEAQRPFARPSRADMGGGSGRDCCRGFLYAIGALTFVLALVGFSLGIDFEANGARKSGRAQNEYALTQAFRIGAYTNAYQLLDNNEKYKRENVKNVGKATFTSINNLVNLDETVVTSLSTQVSPSASSATGRRLQSTPVPQESTSVNALLVEKDHPFDLTKVWTKLQAGAFDGFINTPDCFATNEPDSSLPSTFAATLCNTNVVKACSGLDDFVNMCLGTHTSSSEATGFINAVGEISVPVWYSPTDATGATNAGAFYVDLLNAYTEIITNKAAFDPAAFQVPECWRALYDQSIIPDSSHSNFVYAVMKGIQKQYNIDPNQAFFGGNPPMDFLTGTNNAHIQTVMDAVFGDKNHAFWDSVAPYPATYAGIGCKDIRTDYLNPRGELRSVNVGAANVASAYAALKCVYGTTPAYVTYHATTGVRSSEAASKPTTGATGVGCIDDAHEFVIEPFKVTAASFGSLTNMGKDTKVAWTTVSSYNSLLTAFTHTGTLNDGSPVTLYNGYPVYSRNSINFTVSLVQTTPIYDPVFSVLKADRTEIFQSDGKTSIATYSSTDKVVSIPANTLPKNADVWLVLRGKQGTQFSSNVVALKLRSLGADPTPSFTQTFDAFKTEGTVTAYRNSATSASCNNGWMSTETNFFPLKCFVDKKAFTPITQTITGLANALTTTFSYSNDFVTTTTGNTAISTTTSQNRVTYSYKSFYKCSTSKVWETTSTFVDCIESKPTVAGTYYIWIFDQFGNAAVSPDSFTVAAPTPAGR